MSKDNIAVQKWEEFCKKHNLNPNNRVTREVLEQFSDSQEFTDILDTLRPEGKVSFCIQCHAVKRIKQLYEDFKREQAYFPLALYLEAFMSRHPEDFEEKKE